MRKMLCFALLLPLVAMAAGRADLTKVQTVLNTGEGSSSDAVRAYRLPERTTVAKDLVGRIDTVGGTTYDWQLNGPTGQSLYFDPTYGAHVTWMFSAEQGSGTDRNMRYNFYDISLAPPAWALSIGADWMAWGMNAFSSRSGFGMLDVNPVSGCAYISAHHSTPLAPTMAKDGSPGSGTFEECAGTPVLDNYLWPEVKLTPSERVHSCFSQDPARTDVFTSYIEPWCTWQAAGTTPGPQPGFPNYAEAAAHSSNTVSITWEISTETPEPAYYMTSTDDGATWEAPVQLDYPPAFTPGSETIPSFHISSLYAFYDSQDNLHIAGAVNPVVAGTGTTIPAEIWHWTAAGGWSHVYTYPFPTDTLHLVAPVGYNALFACRPTLGEGATANELVCVWEQFDTMNYEPVTGLARADVMAARSVDGGASWGTAVMITDPDEASKRMPSVANKMHGDTVLVRYIYDLVAGFGIPPYAQGPQTNNPVIVQHVYKGLLPPGGGAVAEGKPRLSGRLAVNAVPNPFHGRTSFSYQLPKSGNVNLAVYDAAGKLVTRLANGVMAAGEHRVDWTPSGVQSGVYFYTLTTGNTKLTKKLTLLQ